MTARNATFAFLLAAVAGLACDDVPDDALERCETRVVFGAVATDILFVIDDSGSMAGEQQKLRDALSRFITTLAASPVADDFQIAVTTTSVEGYGGQDFYPNATSPAPDGTPYPRGVAVAVNASVDPADTSTWGNFVWTGAGGFGGARILASGSPALVDDFRRNVLVGTFGSSREQPLEAARLALTEAVAAGANASFLRPGARLAVVFLTDEEDCSGPFDAAIGEDADCLAAARTSGSTLVPVSEYADFFRGPIGGETREVVLASIAGETCTAGVCDASTLCSGAVSTPGRIVQLIDAMGAARTRRASICDANFDQALSEFAAAIMSQTVPLDGAPADYRMIVASVEKPGAAPVPCTVQPASASAPDRSAAGAIYTPPQQGRPATLTFQGACTLEPGDRIDVKVVCAG